jgi:predicted metal-dependent HD superfamily phosphohydrolase
MAAMNDDLESRWRSTWSDLRLPEPPAAVFAMLCRRWSEPHRKYHTLQHLRECLALFDRDRALAEHPGEVAIALWFHDAIYETTRHDNEAQSAAWARLVLLDAGAPRPVADRVHALVMATRHSEVPATPDERLLVDIDLAILGAEPARFDEYERQIRDEYGHVPEALFRSKRREILLAFLARSPIYATPTGVDRFEVAAKANLARSLAALA